MQLRSAAEVADLARHALAAELLAVDHTTPLLVDLVDSGGVDLGRLNDLVCVVIGIGPFDTPNRDAVDVIVDDERTAGGIEAAVRANPIAATSLVLHLRASEHLPIAAALVAESSTYSTLQAGPEHGRWLAAHDRRPRSDDDGQRVRSEVDGDRMTITLARPARRNAVDAAMQASLADAFAAAADPSVRSVTVVGDGPVFSAGGDLDEFGTLADPAIAHLLRVARSPGRALSEIAAKTTVVVHGACHGAGVELPAFAGTVVARPGTTFTLPEVAMGLVPGAGGTVSLPRRIGRHRTAWLALTGRPLDAETAHRWGLVDDIVDR